VRADEKKLEKQAGRLPKELPKEENIKKLESKERKALKDKKKS